MVINCFRLQRMLTRASYFRLTNGRSAYTSMHTKSSPLLEVKSQRRCQVQYCSSVENLDPDNKRDAMENVSTVTQTEYKLDAGHGIVYKVTKNEKPDPATLLALIQKAAALGNNVGLDEFDDKKVHHLSAMSDVFTISADDTADLIGVIFLHPSPYGRRVIPLTGCFQVILAAEENVPELVSALVDLSVKLTIDKSLGYLGVLTSVFTPSVTWYEKLREKGFTLTATWPSAGKVTKFGLVDNYLMYRRFTGDEIKGTIASEEEILRRAEHVCKDLPHYSVDTSPLVPSPFARAPLKMTLGGVECRLRAVKKEDGPFIYKCLQFAVKHNLGYLEGQFPTYDYFYHTRLTKMQWGAFETLDGDMIMCGGTMATTLTRSVNPDLSLGMMVANPKFFGNRILPKFQQGVTSCMAMYGRSGWLDHAIMSNTPVIQSMKNKGAVFVGCIPDAGLQNGKPVDCTICYSIFTDNDKEFFSQLTASNKL